MIDERGRLTLGGKVVAIVFVLGAIIATAAVFSAWFTVDAGERGVVYDQRQGMIQENYGEGWHFKTPFITDDYIYNVRRQTEEITTEGTTFDGQTAPVTIAVHFKLNASYVWWIHQNEDQPYYDEVIEPGAEHSTKSAMAQFMAIDLIQDRDQIVTEIRDRLEPRMDRIHVELINIDVKDIDFDKEFNQALEAKAIASEEADRQERLVEAARAEANQSIARAEGEAEAIRVINDQLASSPSYLTYFWIEGWNGVTPQVIANGGGDTNAADLLIPVPSQNWEGSATVQANGTNPSPLGFLE